MNTLTEADIRFLRDVALSCRNRQTCYAEAMVERLQWNPDAIEESLARLQSAGVATQHPSARRALRLAIINDNGTADGITFHRK